MTCCAQEEREVEQIEGKVAPNNQGDTEHPGMGRPLAEHQATWVLQGTGANPEPWSGFLNLLPQPPHFSVIHLRRWSA